MNKVQKIIFYKVFYSYFAKNILQNLHILTRNDSKITYFTQNLTIYGLSSVWSGSSHDHPPTTVLWALETNLNVSGKFSGLWGILITKFAWADSLTASIRDCSASLGRSFAASSVTCANIFHQPSWINTASCAVLVIVTCSRQISSISGAAFSAGDVAVALVIN